jgi:hypothetical protein
MGSNLKRIICSKATKSFFDLVDLLPETLA